MRILELTGNVREAIEPYLEREETVTEGKVDLVDVPDERW
jgi:hypothetical protein